MGLTLKFGTTVTLTAALAGMSLSACTEANPAFSPPDPVCAANEYFVGQPFTLADSDKVDILLVVDNSPGMLENQRAFAAAMPQFVTRLNAVEGLDWRVGVVSTDLGDQGDLQTGPAGQADCPASLPQYVERSTPSAGLALGCNVVLGQDGSEFEQGLESARRAVEQYKDTVFRPDARLVVVFFADEDDCTAKLELDRSNPTNCVWQPQNLVSANDFGQYFARSARQLNGNPVSVVALVGPPDNRTYDPGEEPVPSCQGTTPALSGNRYISIAETVGIDRFGFFDSICTTSYVPIVERIVREAVVVSDDELCVSLPMSGTPRAVVLKDASGEQTAELSEEGDYLTLGPTDRCANGALAISAGAHGGAAGNTVEVRFCTTENPSGS